MAETFWEFNRSWKYTPNPLNNLMRAARRGVGQLTALDPALDRLDVSGSGLPQDVHDFQF